ncbi:MAG: DUF4093 domain-containing protein [Clostridia bacterium]
MTIRRPSKKCGCRHNRNTWIWYNKENLGTYRKGIRRERHHNLYRSGSRRKADKKKLTERFPDAGQAFLDRSDATKDGDIGIENASPDSIRAALSMAHCTLENGSAAEELDVQDMIRYGLTGQADSAFKRKVAGKALGIGYCNGRAFLQRLNKFGITKEKLEKTLQET